MCSCNRLRLSELSIAPSGKPKSVTEIEPGTTVYGIADAVTRHLGVPISAKSEER
jgi:3-dehydroquinate synthase class II